jgi:hypothetical protein
MLPTLMVVAVTPVAVAPPFPPAGVWFPLGPQGPDDAFAVVAPPGVVPDPVLGPVAEEPPGVLPPEVAKVVVVAPPAATVVVVSSAAPEPLDPVPECVPPAVCPWAKACCVPVNLDPHAEATTASAASAASALHALR